MHRWAKRLVATRDPQQASYCFPRIRDPFSGGAYNADFTGVPYLRRLPGLAPRYISYTLGIAISWESSVVHYCLQPPYHGRALDQKNGDISSSREWKVKWELLKASGWAVGNGGMENRRKTATLFKT